MRVVHGTKRARRPDCIEACRFGGPWRPVPLRPWEGPFTGAERRLPMHPAIAARQGEACRRWRERKRARKAAVQAVERDDGAGALAASETAPAR